MLSASEVLSAILEKPTDLEHVRSLVTDRVTYVSLNYDNRDLHSIMPWCGTHEHAGPESIVKTFVDVGRYWDVISFEPDAVFGSGEYAAMFGRFTYRSTIMKKLVTTPFAVFAKVKEGRCHYLQFMEDTWPRAPRSRVAGNGRSAAIRTVARSLLSFWSPATAASGFNSTGEDIPDL